MKATQMLAAAVKSYAGLQYTQYQSFMQEPEAAAVAGGLEGQAAHAAGSCLKLLHKLAGKADLLPPEGDSSWKACSDAVKTACDMLTHSDASGNALIIVHGLFHGILSLALFSSLLLASAVCVSQQVTHPRSAELQALQAVNVGCNCTLYCPA